MESIERDLYGEAFRIWSLEPSSAAHGYGPEGILRTFDNELGCGEYWAYFRENLFAVNAFSMHFAKAWTMRYRCGEHLCLGCYDDVRGVFQRCAAPLSPGAITVYLGVEGVDYEARFCAGSVARASSITISPDYYRGYLQSRFGGIDDVRAAFALVDGRRDIPELVDLLRRARAYRGRGAAAELFYEGVVSEAVAIVMDRASCQEGRAQGALSKEDAAAIDRICSYIAANLEGDLSCARLAAELHVGQTKLKRLFGQATGLSPASYVTRARMEEAVRLLDGTSLPVARVGKAVGYTKPGAFTEAFRKHKGCAPLRFRTERRRQEAIERTKGCIS